MSRPPWPPGRLLYVASLAAVGLLAALRLFPTGESYWSLAAAVTAGTALLAGPGARAVRSRVPARRRERLGYVLGGLGLLAIPLLLGVGLVVGVSVHVLDAAVLGGVLGLGLVAVAGRALGVGRRREAGP